MGGAGEDGSPGRATCEHWNSLSHLLLGVLARGESPLTLCGGGPDNRTSSVNRVRIQDIPCNGSEVAEGGKAMLGLGKPQS
jgi:hypothetical protein